MKTNMSLRYTDGILWLIMPTKEIEVCRVGSVFNGGFVASIDYLSSLDKKHVLLVEYNDSCWISDVTSASKLGGHKIVGDKPLLAIDEEKSYIIKRLMEGKDATQQTQ